MLSITVGEDASEVILATRITIVSLCVMHAPLLQVASGRFFAKTWTGTTPQGVVACLCLAEAIFTFVEPTRVRLEDALRDPPQLSALATHILTAFGTATMASFVSRFGRNAAGTRVPALPSSYGGELDGQAPERDARDRGSQLPRSAAPAMNDVDLATELQIALYVQGLRFSNSRLRRYDEWPWVAMSEW